MPKFCPPKSVLYKERDENHREPSLGGWWWVIKHFPSKTLQEPLSYSCSVWLSTVIKKDNTWGQHPTSLFLNKGIESQHALHIWRMFTGSLRAQNWQVLCVAIDGHAGEIVQHSCAKLHLILTVVLISRPIGPWKKNSPRIKFWRNAVCRIILERNIHNFSYLPTKM